MPSIDRELLEKYMKGECSPEEESLVHQWIDENDSDEYPIVHREKRYKNKQHKSWWQLAQNIDELRPYASSTREFFEKKRVWAAAATVAILVGFSMWMYVSGQWGSFRYEKQYQTSYGEIKQVTLPDGTMVTLNAESVLKVSKGFNEKNRTVSLDGEAFFDVKHDAAIPFKVKTNQISVTVLGTSFNVSAFNNDPEVNVLLKSGKIMVKETNHKKAESMVLLPGESAIYGKENSSLEIRKLNPAIQLAWQQRIIAFKDADMKEVAHQIERYFGVTMDISGLPPQQWQLTGEYKNQTLEEVLESLSFNYNLKYKIEGSKVVLYEQ